MFASALGFAGLYTFPNPLNNVPQGAALQADNLVANKDGIAESRRGFAQTGTTLFLSPGQYISQYFAYQNHLIVNCTTGSLFYDSSPDGSAAWTAFSGSYFPYGNFLGEKIKGVEANKNFFLTTNQGIQKLSAYNSTPILSGVPPGLDGTGVLSGSGSGFLGSNEQCAYQIVFGYVDVNGNLLLGNPSERILVVNSTGGSDNVTLTFTVPQGLSTNFFYQIYRTPQTTYSATPSLNVPPGAEPQLAAQQNLTSGQISALSVTYTDITPDALLGAALYTNPSQQGALQTDDRPPLCADMCNFSQMMFYANCQTLQNVTFNLISVGSPNGIQLNDTITINGITFTAKASQNNASQQFAFVTGGTVSQNIDTTARNLIQCINANASMTNVYAIYLSGYNSLPGEIELQAVGFSTPVFYVTSSRGGAFSPTLPASGTSFGSSNDVVPNGIYISKVGQPEAVPSVNLIFVGGGDQPIYRILPLRDRVIVLKSDGVFVVTGTTPASLNITLLDSTIICIAPESAKLLNNSVYCMTNQGVVSITESGVTIQSRAVEGDILSPTGINSNFFGICHAISYESERLYILAIPTTATDTQATQEYCYNWVTNAWTRWTMDITCGLVNPFNNRLYLGRSEPDSFLGLYTFASVERKNYLPTDYIDDQFGQVIVSVDPTGTRLTLIFTDVTSEYIGLGVEQTINGFTYIAMITGISGNNTVIVDLQNSTTPGIPIPWNTGHQCFIDYPIHLVFTGTPITAGFPHYLKDWGRIDFWFNAGNFQLINVGFLSNIQQGPFQNLLSSNTGGYGQGPYGQGPYGGSSNFPQLIQTLCPIEISKANWIQPTILLAFPQARFSFLGTTASYEIDSDVSG